MTISKRTSNVNKSKSDTNNMLDVLVEKNQNCLYKTMEEVVPFGAKFHLYLAQGVAFLTRDDIFKCPS